MTGDTDGREPVHVHHRGPVPTRTKQDSVRMRITTLLQPGETLRYVTDGELDHHLPKPPARLLPERPSGPSSRSSVLVVVVLLVIEEPGGGTGRTDREPANASRPLKARRSR